MNVRWWIDLIWSWKHLDMREKKKLSICAFKKWTVLARVPVYICNLCPDMTLPPFHLDHLIWFLYNLLMRNVFQNVKLNTRGGKWQLRSHWTGRKTALLKVSNIILYIFTQLHRLIFFIHYFLLCVCLLTEFLSRHQSGCEVFV